MLKKLKFIAILALIAAIAVSAFTACGESTGDEETSNGTTEPTLTDAPAPPTAESAPATEPDTSPRKIYDEIELVAFDTGDDNFPYNVTSPLNVSGMKFTVNFTIETIILIMPTWVDETENYIVMELYKWDTDYTTTVAGEPVDTVKVENIENNPPVHFEIKEDAAPAGTYLWIISDAHMHTPGGNIGIWSLPEHLKDEYQYADITCFRNGEEYTAHVFKMRVEGYVWE